VTFRLGCRSAQPSLLAHPGSMVQCLDARFLRGFFPMVRCSERFAIVPSCQRWRQCNHVRRHDVLGQAKMSECYYSGHNKTYDHGVSCCARQGFHGLQTFDKKWPG